jgi:hypothetical protein
MTIPSGTWQLLTSAVRATIMAAIHRVPMVAATLLARMAAIKSPALTAANPALMTMIALATITTMAESRQIFCNRETADLSKKIAAAMFFMGFVAAFLLIPLIDLSVFP